MKRIVTLLFASLLMLVSVAQESNAVSRATVTDSPFVLTTDTSNPMYYYIYSGRDGSKVGGDKEYVFACEIPYGDTQYKLDIVYRNPYKVDSTQLWYFVAADHGVKIVSAVEGRMVTVENTTDGGKKVYMQSPAELTNKHYVWQLDQTAGCYAFRTDDGASYLSHYGNWSSSGPQMGLYNADGSKDEGSRVYFDALDKEAEAGIATPPAKPAPQAIYTLTGQRIARITAPGIYIVDGRKVVVK